MARMLPLGPLRGALAVLSLGLALPSFAAATAPSLTPYGLVVLGATRVSDGVNNLDVPVFAKEGGTQGMSLTARQTRFGLKGEAGPLASIGATLSGQLEADFFGGFAASPTNDAFPLPRLRHAFAKVTWRNVSVLVGQDWSVVASLAPVSALHLAVPGLAGNGNLWARLAQIRVSAQFGDEAGLKVGLDVAAVDPMDTDSVDTSTGYVFAKTANAAQKTGMPAAEGRLHVSYPIGDKRAVLGAGGHFGKERHTLGSGSDKDLTRWLAAVDLFVPVLPQVELSGEYYLGTNTEHMQGGIWQGLKKTFDATDKTKLTGVANIGATGFWGALTLRPWEGLLLVGAYGQDSAKKDDIGDTARAKSTTIMGSAGWVFDKRFTLAVEFNAVKTELKNGKAAEANVVSLGSTTTF